MAFRRTALGLALVSVVVLPSCTAESAVPAQAPTVAFPRTSAGAATWAPWPSALHDARHSGAAATAGPARGTVRWRRRLEGPVTPGPVVGEDGTIYVASNGGVLHALDPADGHDRWTYDAKRPIGGDLSISPLVLPDGTILFPNADELVALSAAGKPLWTQTLPGRVTSPVSADGRRVYVGTGDGTVSAVDTAAAGDHRLVWSVDTGSASYGSVVTDGRGRVYTTADSSLVAIDDRGGSAAVAWRADPHDDLTEVSAGLAPDGTVLLGTNGHDEWAYHPDGTPAWRAPRVITYSSPAVTATGLAYVADHSGQVHVLDAGSGREKTHYGPIGAQIWSSTVLDRDYRVYFGGQNGHAYGFDRGGARLFDVDLGGKADSYPALTGDGFLVIGSRNGFVTAIG
ncbi:PQQ-binding-like beta-propeller repeat protein [Amycolatopsis sp. FDAARGOS 1241]|uniref:outer membrane protein assembly factor BamB family protein n=1 Tax=Amycolatopsis sp. FDAARGOS 1241 TaxID=2778070 RepID=UPI001951C8DE|nr:PQQ-binding-like beta-propeller repeat protein [Amycolatopsis sp. FDAARGOS 1241]QRP50173.1 PQQ-binding-like beta-propeller repeat protein [Amycolatopsis sp. FDAARGOS 1241]